MSTTNQESERPAIETDVLIIGAGINGAGLFRDLAEQNVATFIIDKNDFGSGTSAAPSRLIHGGVKYIETAELGLVSQSTLERNLLLKNAPHQVKPLETTIPIFSWFNGVTAAIRTMFGSKTAPRSRGAVLIKIGLMIYDFFGARQRVMPKHKMLLKKAALKRFPQLNNRIVAAGIYFDAKVNYPERLVLELIKDGMQCNSLADAANYTQVIGLQNGKVIIRDDWGKEQLVSAKIVINAAGPWIDGINEKLGEPSKFIGGTKGSHIVIDNPELATQLQGQMIYFEADDGRICLIFEYLGQLIVGSSDIPDADPDNVVCTEHEIDYFIESVQSLLPGASIERDQITYAYSGIRPLPNSESKEPGLISRDHSTPRLEPNSERPFAIVSLVGGKWTTFRGFAEEVADSILSELGRHRIVTTQNLSIGGGKDYPRAEQLEQWLSDKAQNLSIAKERMALLLERYGTLATQLATSEVAQHAEEIDSLPGYSDVELGWLAENEMVRHLDDLLIRRTPIAIQGGLTLAGVNSAAQVCGARLKWSTEQCQNEVERTLLLLRNKHQMTL